jgi:hypothetical protein
MTSDPLWNNTISIEAFNNLKRSLLVAEQDWIYVKAEKPLAYATFGY